MFEESLEAIAARQPWRQRVGYPNSVDDPMWSADSHKLCKGHVEYEGTEGSKYWVCTKCGYIGWATVTQHYPVTSLRRYFEQSRDSYLQHKLEEGVDEREVIDQMNYLMGATLRAALSKKPEQLRDFVEKLSRL